MKLLTGRLVSLIIITAMVSWLEARTDKEFGLQKLLDPWPTPIGKRGAIFEAEDAIYEFVEQ